jgi:hypothetical protein
VYLLVPSAMTLLLMLEQVIGVLGPNPLLRGPIAAATVIALAGLWLMREERAQTGRTCSRSVLRLSSTAVAIAALLAAAVTLALPVMLAAVQATRADGTAFRASFGLYGYEVAGAWIAVFVALSAVGMAIEPMKARQALLRSVALIPAAAAWPFVATTPLRTLTSFIPSDIQVDYGSEFARIDFSGGPPILAAFALAGALIAVALTLWCRFSVTPSQVDSLGDDREVHSE